MCVCVNSELYIQLLYNRTLFLGISSLKVDRSLQSERKLIFMHINFRYNT